MRLAAQRFALAACGRSVDSVGEQKKLKVRKILENAADSHTSASTLCWAADSEALPIQRRSSTNMALWWLFSKCESYAGQMFIRRGQYKPISASVASRA